MSAIRDALESGTHWTDIDRDQTTCFAVDPVPDQGPLAGIATGLRAANGEYAAAVACDMPFVDPGFLEYLFDRAIGHDAAVVRVDEWYQPTQAVYRTDATAEACERALERGTAGSWRHSPISTVSSSRNRRCVSTRPSKRSRTSTPVRNSRRRLNGSMPIARPTNPSVVRPSLSLEYVDDRLVGDHPREDHPRDARRRLEHCRPDLASHLRSRGVVDLVEKRDDRRVVGDVRQSARSLARTRATSIGRIGSPISRPVIAATRSGR